MEATKQITTDKPVLFKKKERRIRKRKCYTLSDETLATINGLVEAGEVMSLSRAIDELARFYNSNFSAVHVHFDAETRGALTRHYMSVGKMLPDALADLAILILKS